MNRFTSSNGITIYVREGGTVQFQHGTREESCGLLQIFPHSEWWQTLREFFQAEADERLGRWRWPENPDYVVQPFAGGGGWNALCESTCVSGTFLSRDAVINSPSYLAPAVLAYIDAHPEPRPWDEAEEGEIWALTGAGGLEQPWRRHEGRWISCTPSLRTYDAARAIAGRCIWSEVSNGD